GDDMMLPAGAAEMNGVALGGYILQGPHATVEFRGFLQVVDAQLDAAQAVDSGVRHGLGLQGRTCGAIATKADGSVDRNWQFIAKSYRREDVTAITFAFLPGALSGCFRNPEGANSQPRTALNRSIIAG